MYKNEDQFVLGQKIKLVIIGVIALFLILSNGDIATKAVKFYLDITHQVPVEEAP